METIEKLKYPIGKFEAPSKYTRAYLIEKIREIETFSENLYKTIDGLNEEQLNTPYRPEGWTIRQVVHHCADSHMNCFIRIKWALTEKEPIIKYYHEGLWGEGIDNKTMTTEPSIQLLRGLHYRLAFLLNSLNEDELNKTFIHPEHNKTFTIKEMIGMYAWHGNHHLEQIIQLKNREKW
jgi:hypothetical protein